MLEFSILHWIISFNLLKSLPALLPAFFWTKPREFRNIGSAYNVNQRPAFVGEQFEVAHHSQISSPQIIELPERYMVGFNTIQPYYGLRVEDNGKEAEQLSNGLLNRLGQISHLVDGSEWEHRFS